MKSSKCFDDRTVCDVRTIQGEALFNHRGNSQFFDVKLMGKERENFHSLVKYNAVFLWDFSEADRSGLRD